MNYTLHQLQIFCELVHCGSVSRTAERLHLTQPAVSIQLRKLQDQFNVPLYEVVGRKVRVTQFGHLLAQRAGAIHDEMAVIEHLTEAFSGRLTGELSFASVSTGKYVLPYFIAPFFKENPAIRLTIDFTNKAQVMEELRANSIDFALVSVLPVDIPVERIALIENALHLVGRAGAMTADKEYGTELLAQLPIIFREAGSGTRFTFERYLAQKGIVVRKSMELTSNEAVKQAVLAGLGYSVMPLIGLRNELNIGQLEIIRVSGFPIRSEWNLIWRQEKRLSPAAEAFVAYLRSNSKGVISDHFNWLSEPDL